MKNLWMDKKKTWRACLHACLEAKMNLGCTCTCKMKLCVCLREAKKNSIAWPGVGIFFHQHAPTFKKKHAELTFTLGASFFFLEGHISKPPPNKGPPWTTGHTLFWALRGGLVFGHSSKKNYLPFPFHFPSKMGWTSFWTEFFWGGPGLTSIRMEQTKRVDFY